MSPRDIPGLPERVLEQLLVDDATGWSARCIRLQNGVAVVVFNPTHTASRLNASIMEELAHIKLGHRGNALSLGHDGAGFRQYKRSEETAAYWVGAAALLPRAVMTQAKQTGVTAVTLARERGVSTALVTFREKVTGIRLV